MSVAEGLRKYRETSKTLTKSSAKAAPKAAVKASPKTATKPTGKAAVATAAYATKKAPIAATPARKKNEKETPKEKAKDSAKEQKKKPGKGTPVEVEKAVDEVVAAETAKQEEEALQLEIEKELKQDSKATSALVKEDYTPVNMTREKLIIEYSPLIKYIAQRIAARLPANIELDDLISSGVIGLMDAIEKYDSSRDNKFKTYAEFRIRGAILDELRAQDWVPRSVREKAKVLERVYNKIEQQKGRQATDEEVCAELNISQDEYHDMLNQVRSVSLLSFDDVSNFSKADRRNLINLNETGNTKASNPFSEVNVASVKKMIADAIADLPEKQRLVLSLYYYEDLNLKEIGRVLDVTESRVSQLHTQAILRLKAKLRHHWDEFITLMA